MLKKFRFAGLAFVLMLSIGLAACGDSDNSSGGGNGDLGDTTITMAGDNYNSATASMHVLAQALEKAGYDVEYKQVDVGTMFAGVADGSVDLSVAAWLPTTHETYWDKYGDQIDKVGKIMDSVPLGLTVPTYMDIDSIKDMKNNTELGKKLDWTITGISPSAGEMQHTEAVIKEYGLDEWNLLSSSGPGMTAALTKAEKAHDPIIVTLWYPHWAFVKWDLKLLKDPKNIYGDPDDIYAIARKGLKEDSPVAYKIISQFHWTKEGDETVMLNHRKGKDKDVTWDNVAEQFVKKHSDLMDEWLKGVDVAQ